MDNKSIRLFVDAHSFDTGYQGTQTFIKELYSRLMAYPNLCIYWGVQNAGIIKELFPEVKPEHVLLYKEHRFSLLRFVFDIPAFIKQYRFHFAHFQYITPFKQPGCQYIVTTHDVLFNDFPADFSFAYRVSRNLLFGRSIKNAALKTTVSGYSQKRISRHFNIPAHKIKVIPNGVNKPEISKEAARCIIREKFGLSNFILYVSRIEPRKNHLLVLNKYLKLKLYKSNIPLVFIGKQSIGVVQLQNAIKSLTAQQRAMLHWFPQVNPDDLQAFYRACRLFVYPSRAEGFGIPPLEAAVCEVPVLCSSATAMGVFDFFEPYTFDPDDEAGFELKLATLIMHPPSGDFLSNVAQTVLNRYQWHHSAQLFYGGLTAGSENTGNAALPLARCSKPLLQFK